MFETIDLYVISLLGLFTLMKSWFILSHTTSEDILSNKVHTNIGGLKENYFRLALLLTLLMFLDYYAIQVQVKHKWENQISLPHTNMCY